MTPQIRYKMGSVQRATFQMVLIVNYDDNLPNGPYCEFPLGKTATVFATNQMKVSEVFDIFNNEVRNVATAQERASPVPTKMSLTILEIKYKGAVVSGDKF